MENISIIEALSITVSSMIIVLATLSLIAIILSFFKFIFKSEQEVAKNVDKSAGKKVVAVNEEDEDEKAVVAIVASIMAAESLNHNNFHIRNIKRIS